eukprot:403366643
MEITVENFEEKFDLIAKSIRSCEFIAFDTEFSGSKIGYEDKPHEFDSLDDKYRKNRSAVQKFLAFQVGITTFMWSNMKKKYIGRPFNFLVYPRHILQERYHHANSDTIDFLKRYSFDFNKVFRYGLTTLKLTIDNFKIRQQLSREIFKKFGFGYFRVEFSKDNDSFTVVRLQSNEDTGTPISMSSFNNTDAKKNGKSSVNSKYQMSDKDFEMQNNQEVIDITEYEIGFSKVVEEMINAKKPLVGHNMMLDIMFLYQQFIDDLPLTLREFIVKFQEKFPAIYDTKAISQNMGVNLFNNKTDLNSMSTQILQKQKFKSYLEFDYDIGHNFTKYQSKQMLHEAGYDSYLTGLVFASLIKYLEVQHFNNYQKKLQKQQANLINTYGGICSDQDMLSDGQNSSNNLLCQLNKLQMIDSQQIRPQLYTSHNQYIPSAQSAQELANLPIVLDCVQEFKNFIMIALEGQKFMKFDRNYKDDTKINGNVLKVQMKEDMSAYDISKLLSVYGDVFVIKDSQYGCFVEFTYLEYEQTDKNFNIEELIAILKADLNISKKVLSIIN